MENQQFALLVIKEAEFVHAGSDAPPVVASFLYCELLPHIEQESAWPTARGSQGRWTRHESQRQERTRTND